MSLGKLERLQQEAQKILVEVTALSARLAEALADLSHTPPAPTTWVPPGHIYSPIVDLELLAQRAAEVFNPDRPLPQIDLRAAAQLALLADLSPQIARLVLPDNVAVADRFYYQNPYFPPGDAQALAGLLMHLRPRRFIEVGSGYTSALALEIDRQFLGRTTEFTFIEPYPERLYSLISAEDRARHSVLERPVQDVPLDLFKALESGDFLFIDSTHVSKAGGDVHYEIFEILPVLKSGVYVHFHDIFYPFEYPQEWFFKENRSWNEIYLLRAFLMNNYDYEIIMFNDFIAQKYPEELARLMPKGLENRSGSLWLRRR